jgi:predicted NUDIX family phosphoesterase
MHGPGQQHAHMREDVLVVPRANLLPSAGLYGFSASDVSSYLSAIAAHAFFAPRERVEEDPSLKQIIPYVILRYKDRIFLVHRARGGGEKRLREKFSIGLGGHITPHDVTDQVDPVQAGLEREVAEEVEMPPGWKARPIGVLNDDVEPVGRVHFGLVYVADVSSPAVRVRETNKLEGAFATLAEIRAAYDRLETWSQFVVDAIDLREI